MSEAGDVSMVDEARLIAAWERHVALAWTASECGRPAPGVAEAEALLKG